MCVLAAALRRATRPVNRRWWVERRGIIPCCTDNAATTEMLRNASSAISVVRQTVGRSCFCHAKPRSWRWSLHVRRPAGLFTLPGRRWCRPPFCWRRYYVCSHFRLGARSVSTNLSNILCAFSSAEVNTEAPKEHRENFFSIISAFDIASRTPTWLSRTPRYYVGPRDNRKRISWCPFGTSVG